MELPWSNGQPLGTNLLALWHTVRVPLLVSLALTYLAVVITSRLRARASKSDSPPSPSILEPQLSAEPDGTVPLPEKFEADVLSKKRRKLSPASNRRPKRIAGTQVQKKKAISPVSDGLDPASGPAGAVPAQSSIQVFVFYSSLTGSTAQYAEKLAKDLFSEPPYVPTPAPPVTDIPDDSPAPAKAAFLPPIVENLDYLDLDDYFITPATLQTPNTTSVYLLVIPTYEITSPVDAFLEHLSETHHDFRIDTKPLRSLAGFSVFGLGDKEGWPAEEGRGGGVFCGQAKEVDRWMAKLTGGKRIFPIGMGDVKNDAMGSLREWREHLEILLRDLASGEVIAESNTLDSEDEEDIDQEDTTNNGMEPLVDVEDIGNSMRQTLTTSQPPKNTKSASGPIAIDFTTTSSSKRTPKVKEMVPKDSPTYNSLTKQGYTIVGSHSGVKICRWTKSALRGRGSCYKYSFYGIKSHLCMETTPSLSCSNKCVFCWRHGTNPVSTTWNWTVDPPDMILQGAMDGHYQKIKMMKGVPGVRADRFAEAFRIRHCALSLVGEPIFYPHINEFLDMLHSRRISSFLVCNAQHPDQLARLKYVTQLYVSIDASNKESLRRIDRPLHRDFWERFMKCLEILRAKRHRMRTVYRLTLVKGFNIEEEAEGYADLVEKGLPAFVEIKGVTYCGTSTSVGAGLSMSNVPFYEEVCEFVRKLNDALGRRGLKYGIAAEHAHSCCVLIASNDYFIDGRWHTVIHYERFFELLETGKEFGPLDYVGPPTEEWAVWGQGGFNPADERVYRKGKNKGKTMQEVAGGEAESGCG
ncbi:hypothetical protein DRE_00887 [Drechslerella stenobrocha 248]|uniref:S-adenosyl-L-methionine-dependent tRNA 4-demethylwyosine synthase n=1 Tax=Drechslerella stenobrocha 248 TaxID=1043628 RepID=W7I007_9PEZI|nr:hypothetical protein DRE_00887 [Drechslerella stenobrocha 248]